MFVVESRFVENFQLRQSCEEEALSVSSEVWVYLPGLTGESAEHEPVHVPHYQQGGTLLEHTLCELSEALPVPAAAEELSSRTYVRGRDVSSEERHTSGTKDALK